MVDVHAMLADLHAGGAEESVWLQDLLDSERVRPLPLLECLGRADAVPSWKLTPALVDTLRRIDRVVDEQGYRLLCDALQRGGVDYPTTTTWRGLAVWCALNEPRVLDLAIRLRTEVRSCRMRTFAAPVDQAVREPSVSRLEELLSDAFRSARRTSHCRVLSFQDDGGWHFMVGHGSSLRCVDTVDTHAGGTREQTVRLRPRRRDYLHYDPAMGVLSVGAWDATTLRIYREAFGEVMFGSPASFGSGELVTLEPLRDLGRRSLLATASVHSVLLTRLVVRAPGPFKTRLTLESDDVFASLDEDPGAKASFENGTLLAATLKVRVAGIGRARSLDLAAPDRLGYNWQKGGAEIRGFLVRRGFLATSP